MDDLFAFLANDDLHPIIRSSVLLYRYHPAFAFIPIDSELDDFI